VGLAAKPVSGIWLKDITVEKTATPSRIVNTRDLEMRNVRMNGKPLAYPARDESAIRSAM
jgi:hypothetical protein